MYQLRDHLADLEQLSQALAIKLKYLLSDFIDLSNFYVEMGNRCLNLAKKLYQVITRKGIEL